MSAIKKLPAALSIGLAATGAIDPRLFSDRRNPQVVSEIYFAGGNISP
jgi:hypothetical protein